MAYKGQKVQKVMVQPINLIFRYLQNGFDEYMNLVLDEAEEIHLKSKTRRQLGRILMKGDNITLLMNAAPS
ncbi:Small nuclear ribonucleoprotein E [Exaiptasia diaphana]|nr:Small nuclear ribonucleoprotein E [Exaiptasia diaphana]